MITHFVTASLHFIILFHLTNQRSWKTPSPRMRTSIGTWTPY